MPYTDQDKNFIQEDISLDFSVDDILADYYTSRPARPAAPIVPEGEDEDVRVYVPGKAKSSGRPAEKPVDHMETFAAAFSALEQYESPAEESYGYNNPWTYSYDEKPGRSDRDEAPQESFDSYSRYDTGRTSDYSRYDYSQPSEEEVRAYLASLTEEDILRMSGESQVYESRYKNGFAAENDESEEPWEPEIDSRFNLGRDVFKNNSSMRYDGQELDLSAEPDYEPSRQSGSSPSHWAEGEGEMRQELPDKKSKKGRKGRKGRKAKEDSPAAYVQPRYSDEEDDYVRSFRDYSVSEGVYAERGDYDAGYEDELDKLGAEADFFPSSFKEYIFSLAASMLFGMRGGKAVSATMEDDDEDLGAELSPEAASKYYGSFTRSMRLRFRISLIVLILMAYISFGLPVPGMLGDYMFASAALMGMQLCIMILCLDVFTGAIVNIGQGRAGADTLAAISCIITTVDATLVSMGTVNGHLPLCAVSSLSLVGVMLSSLLSTRGLRKAIRVPAIGKKAYAVTGEMGVKKGEVTLLKSMRPSKGFVRRAEETAPDENYFNKAFLPTLLLALLLAGGVALLKKSFGDFIFIFSAVLAPAAPFAALLGFALPFFIGSMRIFPSGAAIAGWSGLSDIGQSKNLIVTDRDLFPEEAVELENVRIFADEDAQKVVSYAGTMISAAGSAVSGCFAELMVKNGCTMRQVEGFEYLPGGGMKGMIEGDYVICGNSDLMRLMNIRIPTKLVDRNSVLLAINNVLYGIFSIKYTAMPQVRKALVQLMKSNRHPIFAIRDFNITPEMLHRTFDLATDGYDFPPYVERFEISSAQPSEDSKISAVICREGLGPLTHMADTGRTMYLAVRANLVISALASVIGMLTVFIKFMTVGFVTPGFLLGFMLLWALPVFVFSVFMKS